MSTEILTKFLTVLFGYAMPALECFKAVEQRTGRTDQLGFGASIGTDPEALISEIILVILVIFDEIGRRPDIEGTDIVYETFVRPLVMQYEPNIEERLRYLRANAGDLIVFYLKNFTDRGYELFLRALDYVRSQASRGSRTRSFFSFRGDRGERPSFVEDDYVVPGGDRRRAARQRRPGPGDY